MGKLSPVEFEVAAVFTVSDLLFYLLELLLHSSLCRV